MPDAFTLRIGLGNDAMQSKYDVAGALRRVAEDLFEDGGAFGHTSCGYLTDENGNTVGSWTVEA